MHYPDLLSPFVSSASLNLQLWGDVGGCLAAAKGVVLAASVSGGRSRLCFLPLTALCPSLLTYVFLPISINL